MNKISNLQAVILILRKGMIFLSKQPIFEKIKMSQIFNVDQKTSGRLLLS